MTLEIGIMIAVVLPSANALAWTKTRMRSETKFVCLSMFKCSVGEKNRIIQYGYSMFLSCRNETPNANILLTLEITERHRSIISLTACSNCSVPACAIAMRVYTSNTLEIWLTKQQSRCFRIQIDDFTIIRFGVNQRTSGLCRIFSLFIVRWTKINIKSRKMKINDKNERTWNRLLSFIFYVYMLLLVYADIFCITMSQLFSSPLYHMENLWYENENRAPSMAICSSCSHWILCGLFFGEVEFEVDEISW